jgi:hypothetical protein
MDKLELTSQVQNVKVCGLSTQPVVPDNVCMISLGGESICKSTSEVKASGGFMTGIDLILKTSGKCL